MSDWQKEIGAVTLFVEDLDRSKLFYQQVFDLQPVRAEVTEHQLIERECGCGQRTRGAAPPGAEAPVQ